MKNEIKEILYVLKDIVIGRATRLTCREADKLLDYITNLQTIEQQYSALLSENAELENRTKELETINEEHRKINGELREENERLKEIVENLTTMTASGDGKQIKNTAQFKLDICKQRIDKAIEYVKSNLDNTNWLELGSQDVEVLLNILQGSDE